MHCASYSNYRQGGGRSLTRTQRPQINWVCFLLLRDVLTFHPCPRGVTRWPSWLRHRAISRKFRGSIPDGVMAIFHSHNPSRPHYGPGVDSVSNINEYQEYFLGGKGGRCVGLTTLLHSCADCLEIWEPQPRGTLRACPGL